MNRVWRFAQRHPAYRMGRYELGLYRDLWRWIHGEQLIPVGAVALPHPPGRLQMMAMFTVVLVVEMVVLHLLLPPGALRIVALLLSIWAVVFIWGLTASERVRPSYITDDETVLRRGRKMFTAVPASTVRARRQERTFISDVEVADGVLTVGGPAGTDTTLELAVEIEAAPDRYPWQKAQTEPVTRVRFYAGEAGC